MGKGNRKLFWLTLAFGLVLSGSTFAQQDEFEMGNKFYEDKDYSSAVRMYASALNQGYESASLYFNLGSAYFKSGDLGRATLYLMKAKRLDPSDEDITQNLEFARQFSRVQMEGVQLNPVYSFFESLVGPYRLALLAWLSSALFIMTMLLLTIRYGLAFRNAAVRIGFTICLTLLAISVGLTTFKYQHDYLIRRAVIIAEETPVMSGPSEQSEIELQGSPGLVVEILLERDDYYNVLFENKRRGWIRTHLVAEI